MTLNIRNILIKIVVFLLRKLIGKETTFEVSGYFRERQTIFLKNVAKLVEYAHTLPGYELTGGELYRPPEMQAIYYADGRSHIKHSKHQDRLAIDFNLFVNGKYIHTKAENEKYFKPLAEYWASLHPNNVSGWDWKWDYNHFQMK